MVQGLGFLSKKSWHVKNIANQEKVWIAEQRKEAEVQKTKELAKQIQMEREQDELDALAGKKTLDRGIHWMYEGQNKESEIAKEDEAKKAEEFLLGKEYVPEGAPKGDLDDGAANEGVNAVVAAASEKKDESYYGPTVAERNEAFRVQLEDPMFAVSKQYYDRKQEHERKKELYEKVTGKTAVDKTEKKRKKDDRKRRKKERKREKRSRRERSYSSERSDSRSYRRDSRRSRSRSPARRRRSYSRSRSPERYRRRDRSPRDDRRRYDDDRRRDYYDRRRISPERDDRRRDHGRDDRSRNEKRYDRQRQEERRTDRHDDEQAPKKEGYGLLGGKTSAKPKDLGPDRELLQRKRVARAEEERAMKEAARSRQRLTADERARALAAMESTAASRQVEREQQLESKRHDDEEEGPTQESAQFLRDVSQKTHGVRDNDLSLQDRLRQNRFTNQRLDEKFL